MNSDHQYNDIMQCGIDNHQFSSNNCNNNIHNHNNRSNVMSGSMHKNMLSLESHSPLVSGVSSAVGAEDEPKNCEAPNLQSMGQPSTTLISSEANSDAMSQAFNIDVNGDITDGGDNVDNVNSG